ncbi:MAG: glycosyltransferase family 2 protein [Pirellulales bacterium]|nr:glycosyltransferase family 2 protein [Pirellulales bacterium]
MMNEEESLEQLHTEIVQQCKAHSIDYQIVFVDDGSTDRSWHVAQDLVKRDEATEAIRFRRNFGKAAALSAGFAACRREIVITMDADLQDDPKEIPRFLEKLDEGFDVVSGWKRVRHDPWHKVLPSRVFNALVSRLTKVKLHDHNCGFKAYRRDIFDEVTLYGELHRFVPVLANARGWQVGEIEVEHHARRFGRSKYGVSRLVKGFLDLLTIYFLTAFAGRPFHFIGSAGLISFASGGVTITYLTLRWIMTRQNESAKDDLHLHESALFYFCILAVLLGAILLVAGLLAELIVSRTSSDHQPYGIAERIGDPGSRGDSGLPR